MCFVPLSVESLLVCCACCCCCYCCLTDLVSVCLVVTFAYAAAKVIAFAQPSTSTSTSTALQLCLPETRPTAPQRRHRQLLKCPKMSNCLSTQRRFVPLPPSHSPCPTLSLPLLICLRFLRFGIQLKFSAWAALVTLGFIWKIRANCRLPPLPSPPSLLHALFVTFAIVIQITLRLRLHPFALIAHHLTTATVSTNFAMRS